ncbi:extracellular solute-binding protein [Hamadaea sp. NPDC051192]|uniref:extracellular solute-binding protein n=1 Tax=Hamadaea sp. NPDC051192 TaxID=3154940 RepID=UPI00341406AD
MTEVSRRTMLRGVVSAAIAGTIGTGALAACSTDGTATSGASNAAVKLPTLVPYTGVPADLPQTAEGARPAYFAYPANPPKFTTEAPARGGTIQALCTMNTPPVPVDSNKYWQNLNQRLGAELKINGAPTLDYVNKFQTVMAGGDLPDTMEVRSNTPQLPGLLAAKFQDLTEYLSGDAVKNYPALANIPTESWQSTVYNGGIYGVPLHTPPIKVMTYARQDLIEGMGLSLNVTSGKEFVELCKQLANPRANQWATCSMPSAVTFVNQMLGVPNGWANEGGTFTKDYESAEYKKALDVVAGMWKDGLFHPDSFSATSAQKISWITSGTVKLLVGVSTWSNVAVSVRNTVPTGKITPIQPPKFDGGGPAKTYLGPAIFSITGLKKGSKARIEEVLRVLNWLQAPWGTDEHRTRLYGLPDWDFSLKGTDPITTATGKSEVTVPTLYIGACPVVHYAPGFPDITKTEYEGEQAGLSNAVAWPLAGLYSATDQSQGAVLDKKMLDLQADIITGRKPLSDWDEGVSTWKKTYGDKIRGEYADAWQKSGK